MAAISASNITNITRSIAAGFGTGLQLAGAPITAFRVASGQAGTDTATLVPPPEFGNIRAVIGPVGHNLPTSGTGASNVAITVFGPTTPTVPAFEIILIGSPAAS
jgi:hypothetical protein